MHTSHATVATEHASRYLQQLCKHWAHKFEVEFTPEAGRIALPRGPVRLAADAATLRVDLEAADADGLERMKGVVADHIARFAFRETLVFDWS